MKTPPRKVKSKFEKLQEKWYGKLKKKGFTDIEDKEGRLMTWSTKLFGYHQSDSWTAKRDYFQMAENFINDYKFESELHRIIWTYHANGISCREIAKLLKDAGIKHKSKTPVFEIIKKLKYSMYAMYIQPQKEYHE